MCLNLLPGTSCCKGGLIRPLLCAFEAAANASGAYTSAFALKAQSLRKLPALLRCEAPKRAPDDHAP